MSALQKQYRQAAQAANEQGLPNWESQIVHSDWHPGNLIFEGHVVAAVLDFDAARIRPRVMDIANGCLQFSFIAGGRDLKTWKAETDSARATEFLRGYDSVNVISQAELQAIPPLMQEAMIAQSVPPILKTGHFAGLDGYEFLKIVLAKVQWLEENRGWIRLDETTEKMTQ